MPKAKVKRKGVVLGPEDGPGVSKKLCLSESEPTVHTENAQFASGDFPSTSKGCNFNELKVLQYFSSQ